MGKYAKLDRLIRNHQQAQDAVTRFKVQEDKSDLDALDRLIIARDNAWDDVQRESDRLRAAGA